jgi:hypothetical protein
LVPLAIKDASGDVISSVPFGLLGVENQLPSCSPKSAFPIQLFSLFAAKLGAPRQDVGNGILVKHGYSAETFPIPMILPVISTLPITESR